MSTIYFSVVVEKKRCFDIQNSQSLTVCVLFVTNLLSVCDYYHAKNEIMKSDVTSIAWLEIVSQNSEKKSGIINLKQGDC
jgi:hypothetical protein